MMFCEKCTANITMEEWETQEKRCKECYQKLLDCRERYKKRKEKQQQKKTYKNKIKNHLSKIRKQPNKKHNNTKK